MNLGWEIGAELEGCLLRRCTRNQKQAGNEGHGMMMVMQVAPHARGSLSNGKREGGSETGVQKQKTKKEKKEEEEEEEEVAELKKR